MVDKRIVDQCDSDLRRSERVGDRKDPSLDATKLGSVARQTLESEVNAGDNNSRDSWLQGSQTNVVLLSLCTELTADSCHRLLPPHQKCEM